MEHPKLKIVMRRLEELKPHPRNSRVHSEEQVALIAANIEALGFLRPITIDGDDFILAGHGAKLAARALGMAEVPTVCLTHLSEEQKRAYIISDNKLAEQSTWDEEILAEEMAALSQMDFNVGLTGFSADEIQDMIPDFLKPPPPGDEEPAPETPPAADAKLKGSLAARFLLSPFTTLDARAGWWTNRKRLWKALGLKSETGRGEDGGMAFANMRGLLDATSRSLSETSIFDPVICELIYRWFVPPGGVVIDPFAGGSVRGVVAAALGLNYVGVDLRQEQIEANREQWREIGPKLPPVALIHLPPDNMPDLTPVERRGGYWFKRDDSFCFAGVRGGKVRTCWQLAAGAEGLITAGSRQSPQANIVAQIANRLEVPCRVHVPEGELGAELMAASAAGAEIVQHKAGHNSVIIARAREDAEAAGFTEIPFGMECEDAVFATATQVKNIPDEVKRLVMPVGSGMSLAGVLRGLLEAGRDLPIIGVRVGADPEGRLDEFAPKDWRDRVTLVTAPFDYHQPAPITELAGVPLDPIYEAKCLPFVEPGDLLWVVGIRQTMDRTLIGESRVCPDPLWHCADSSEPNAFAEIADADMVFSCPPYFDLEVYSEDDRDLSTMDWAAFAESYAEIIDRAVSRLKDDRFACFVVGDVRDKDGFYRRFVDLTVHCFEQAGARLYNDAVLIEPLGSAAIRATKPFTASRKMLKTHQNVLVFCKGDPRAATQACGIVDLIDAGTLEQAEANRVEETEAA